MSKQWIFTHLPSRHQMYHSLKKKIDNDATSSNAKYRDENQIKMQINFVCVLTFIG